MTDKPTLGEDLRDTLHAHGILGHILGCDIHADAASITVVRTMLDSRERPALFVHADGEVDIARVYETFDLNATRRLA